MKEENRREEIMGRLAGMAFERPNDAVKLAFLGGDGAAADAVDGLDLSMLSEVKRAPNGAVELKLVSRLEIMKLLLDELRAEGDGGADFLRALDGGDGTRSDGN